MKLTSKDAEFLAKLKALMEDQDLAIEVKHAAFKYFVLRRNYGDRVESHFGMTRQGVRWRFQRLFNEIYVSAYTTILWVEANFGHQLRGQALEIAKQRTTHMREVVDIDRHANQKR